ncbi:MAG: hypothetical protein ABSG14_01325 [Verrucomicrobiia bacterium]
MDASTWLGLVSGLVLGGGYGLLQCQGLRRNTQPPPSAGLLAARGIVRLVCLAVALLLLLRLTPANKHWLIGGVMIGYAVVFPWYMKGLMVKGK